MRATLSVRGFVSLGFLMVFIGPLARPAGAASVVVNTVPALQSALAAAAAGTGPTDIRIKGGTYEIASTLTLSSPPGGAIITLQNAGDGTVVLHSTSRGRILQLKLGNYLVKGLTFSGGGETATINSFASSLTIADCTFVDNVIAFYTDSSRAVIEFINDTFTQNQSAIQLDFHSSVKIRNSTIANNNSTINPFQPVGIGIAGLEGAADVLANSIVFGNRRDCLLFQPHSSIVNSIDGDGTCGAPLRIDPRLAALADNGGLVKTMALPKTSPAVGAGSSGYCPPADARGAGRPAPPAGCDIGAFERSGNFQIESATGAGPVSFATDTGTFVDFHAVDEATLPTNGKPSGVTFPFGFFDWTIIDLTPGQMVMVTITFPSPLPTPAQYWKVDSAGTWTDLCRALNCTLVGTNQLKFAIADGGLGDFDNRANGEIRGTGGLGAGGMATTTTTVTSTANPSVFGQAVSFTALVASGASAPAGAVQFAIDGASSGAPVAIDATGTAHSASISTLGVGPHDVQATYSGSSPASTGILAGGQLINRAATTTTPRSSANPSVFGQPVSFTAAVAAVAPGAGNPTGTVDFAVDGVLRPVGLGPMGTATFNTASLAVGSHTITETYSGDGDFVASSSQAFAQAVGKAATSVGLVTSSSNVAGNQPVTFSATVAAVPPGSGTPSGTVVFQDGAITLGSAVLDTTGVARFTTSTLALGSHAITAQYGGDGSFSASSAPVLTQNIAIATTMTITSSSNPALAVQDITFTATISFASPLTPTTAAQFRGAPGDIQLQYDGFLPLLFSGSPVLNAPDQTGNYTSASVAVQMHAPPPGRHTIAGQYSCSGPCILAGSSSTLTQTVNAVATTMTIASSSNPSLAGQRITFTATVNFASPLNQVSAPGFSRYPGVILFQIDGNPFFQDSPMLDPPDQSGNYVSASAVIYISIPSPYALPGSHTIVAQYSCTQPQCIVSGSSSTLTQTVNPVATRMTITSSSNPSLAGKFIAFTATISFAIPLNQVTAHLGFQTTPGNIQFQIDGKPAFQGSPVLDAPDAPGPTGTYASASVGFVVPDADPATLPGIHTIAAQYSCTLPGCIVSGSSSVLTQTVNNTAAGSNVSVSPVDAASGKSPASVTFSNVTRAGLTTLTISNSGAAPPAGFELGTPPTYFDLSTTAVFSGSITVCINYGGITFPNPPPRLFHFENGAWIDTTISLDTTGQLICGMVTSLSPFAIFQTNTLPGRMHGEGSVDAGGLRHDFEFRVKKRADGKLLGSFQYRQQASGSRDSGGEDEHDPSRPLNRFVSSAITFAGFSGAPPATGHFRNRSAVNSVTFGGFGRWNGASGFKFEVTAKSPRGEPGIIAITIRAAGGAIVASVTGTLREEDSEARSEGDHRESEND